MGKIYKDIEQGTPEWFAIRCGKITASRMNDVMAILKTGGEPATRKNYKAQLVAERLTNVVEPSYSNKAMDWGREQEPFARTSYELAKNTMVDQICFSDHDTIQMTGASPDGLVGEDGLVEIKCPNTATHIEYLEDGKAPSDYIKQMQWQMACTDRTWCDFVSFDPRMPEDLRLFIVRIERDDTLIAEMEKSVIKFNEEIETKISNLRSRK